MTELSNRQLANMTFKAAFMAGIQKAQERADECCGCNIESYAEGLWNQYVAEEKGAPNAEQS